VAALNTLGANFLGGAAAAGDFVVYSPTHREMATVTVASTWQQWASLRSRRD
jgi:hypothetical protein